MGFDGSYRTSLHAAMHAVPYVINVGLAYYVETNHEFHETCHSVTFHFVKKDSTTPESIHTKDESKRGSAFAFIFGVN